MTYKPNKDQTVAVAVDYYWQRIDTCPTGLKVQLLGAGGVPHYGIYRRADTFYTHWAPLPKIPKDEK